MAATCLTVSAFSRATSSSTVPIEFFRGLPLVQVVVNQSAPAWFLIDTASTWSFLDVSVADRLKLARSGSRTIMGGGDNPAEITFASGVSLRVGDVTQTDDHIAVMRLPFKYDRPVAGMIGSPFLSRFVVTFDYKAATLELSSVAPQGSSTHAIPFRLEAGIPVVEARIVAVGGEPIAGAFHIDTAASQTVILNRPFALAHGFAADAQPAAAIHAGSLTGGTSYVRSSAASITLGDIVIPNPMVNVSLDTRGSGSRADAAGLIGNGVLSAFVMTLDYPRRLLMLQ